MLQTAWIPLLVADRGVHANGWKTRAGCEVVGVHAVLLLHLLSATNSASCWGEVLMQGWSEDLQGDSFFDIAMLCMFRYLQGEC